MPCTDSRDRPATKHADKATRLLCALIKSGAVDPDDRNAPKGLAKWWERHQRWDRGEWLPEDFED